MDAGELEILKTALLSEVEGEKYYREAASKVQDPEVSRSFIYLAEDELKHQMMLRSCLQTLMREQDELIDTSIWISADSPQIFTAPNAPHEFREMELSVYHIAILMEKASIDFYRQAAAMTKSKAARTLYEFLVNWEIGHLDAMEKIYDRLTEDWWDEQHFSPA